MVRQVFSLLIPSPLFSLFPSWHSGFHPLLQTDRLGVAAHLLCSHRLVSPDWHAQCVSWNDLPACVALLLKFLCQIPNEASVAGSAWLAGLSPLACLMKRTPVGFIIKAWLITDAEVRGGGRGWQNGEWTGCDKEGFRTKQR